MPFVAHQPRPRPEHAEEAGPCRPQHTAFSPPAPGRQVRGPQASKEVHGLPCPACRGRSGLGDGAADMAAHACCPWLAARPLSSPPERLEAPLPPTGPTLTTAPHGPGAGRPAPAEPGVGPSAPLNRALTGGPETSSPGRPGRQPSSGLASVSPPAPQPRLPTHLLVLHSPRKPCRCGTAVGLGAGGPSQPTGPAREGAHSAELAACGAVDEVTSSVARPCVPWLGSMPRAGTAFKTTTQTTSAVA